jgi:hypothetical protein
MLLPIIAFIIARIIVIEWMYDGFGVVLVWNVIRDLSISKLISIFII